MGYNAYITRRTDWSKADEPSITEAEWSACVASEPALASLYWAQGNVVAKNPDRALVQEMHSAAVALGATVQGDDGEVYDAAGDRTPHSTPSFLARVQLWLRNLVSPGAGPVREESIPFKVGDRVRGTWGNFGHVTAIEVRAEHGLGRITIKYESGRVAYVSAHSHGTYQRADA
jgi:hypothetical protein